VRDHRAELVLIVSGDHIYSMDYRPMIRQHIENRADLTIAFTRVPPEQASRFGTATLDATGLLTGYQEKAATPDSDLASMTVYAFNVDVLARRLAENMKTGRTFQIYDEIIPRMVAEGDRVFGHIFEGSWRYARTIDAYYEANLSILAPDAPDLEAWEVRTNLGTASASDRPPATFRAGARVTGSLVAPGARIAGTVERSVISAGVVVERDAVVRDSVVMHDCRVASGAVLDRVILDKEVTVGADAHLGVGEARPNRKAVKTLTCGAVVVGKGTRIPAGARVGRNCIVPPDLAERYWPRRPIRSGTTVKP
jgi:glucose-1-phosphate adenylyltransferase